MKLFNILLNFFRTFCRNFDLLCLDAWLQNEITKINEDREIVNKDFNKKNPDMVAFSNRYYDEKIEEAKESYTKNRKALYNS